MDAAKSLLNSCAEHVETKPKSSQRRFLSLFVPVLTVMPLRKKKKKIEGKIRLGVQV